MCWYSAEHGRLGIMSSSSMSSDPSENSVGVIILGSICRVFNPFVFDAVLAAGSPLFHVGGKFRVNVFPQHCWIIFVMPGCFPIVPCSVFDSSGIIWFRRIT